MDGMIPSAYGKYPEYRGGDDQDTLQAALVHTRVLLLRLHVLDQLKLVQGWLKMGEPFQEH